MRGAIVLALVLYPLLAWWLSYNYHACGLQGVQLALVFLVPIGAFAAIPALLLFAGFAWAPIRLRSRVVLVVAGVETIALVAVYFSITVRQVVVGACNL